MELALYAGMVALAAWIVRASRISGARVPVVIRRRIYGVARRP